MGDYNMIFQIILGIIYLPFYIIIQLAKNYMK